jgi:hypothetical protein
VHSVLRLQQTPAICILGYRQSHFVSPTNRIVHGIWRIYIRKSRVRVPILALLRDLGEQFLNLGTGLGQVEIPNTTYTVSDTEEACNKLVVTLFEVTTHAIAV